MSKEKKKEELKEFTVGSAPQSAAAPKAKAPKTQQKVELSEKDYPSLSAFIKGKDADSFQQEAKKVLMAAQEWMNGTDSQKKSQGELIQKAYQLSLELMKNAKTVR